VQPVEEFRQQPPEFWAVVKLVSQLLGYSASGSVRTYSADDVADCLRGRNLDPTAHDALVENVAQYSQARAQLLHDIVQPNLMDRDAARELFEECRAEMDPPAYLLPKNKQKREKRHYAYLTCLVNMLTWHGLRERFGAAPFDHNPRGPLTFSRHGMPLRTLFRWMDGAYPELNQPFAAWEVKEYYGTTTFGSRVADGVYETALDGYELNDLRSVGVAVEHYLFLDDRFTWWDCGKSYLCRIVDMLHADLLDGAFFGRELVEEWPPIVAAWPEPRRTTR
jgi:hypothetical protein